MTAFVHSVAIQHCVVWLISVVTTLGLAVAVVGSYWKREPEDTSDRVGQRRRRRAIDSGLYILAVAAFLAVVTGSVYLIYR